MTTPKEPAISLRFPHLRNALFRSEAEVGIGRKGDSAVCEEMSSSDSDNLPISQLRLFREVTL